MLHHTRAIAVGIFSLGLALGAQAGPAMFNASFIFHAWGNDITSGTAYPYNTNTFNAVPLGHDCQSFDPYTPNGAPSPRYCELTILREGVPATGSGTLVTGGATVGAPVGLPQSAFGIDITGFNRTYYPYIQSWTYANFVNDAGAFFAGGGAAAGKGVVTHSGMGQQSGQWYIHEGDRGFGGVMGLLGFYGVKSAKWIVLGKVGTFVNTNSNWDMVTPLGREQYATPTAFTPMGKATNWLNPHTYPNTGTNNVNGNTTRWTVDGWGTPWTTGTVTLYAKAGYFTTIHVRTGYDTVTAGGVRNLQLVTPGLVHWIGVGFQGHTGHIGILTLQITPEPGAILLLGAGGGTLALLYGVSRRRTKR
jgi:hypothetical protein